MLWGTVVNPEDDQMEYRLEYDQKQLEECAHRWRMTRIELFGSWARGDSRPDSDVDLLITFAPEAPWNLFDIVIIKEELEAIFRRPVHLLEEGSVTNPFMLKSIRSNRQVLFAD